MILIVSAIFPPEPVVSANLSYDIATKLSENQEVTVISPYPTRPYGKSYKKEEIMEDNPFEHIILKSYTSPESNIIGRFRESYSLGKATKRYIEENYRDISVIYANTWPIFAQKNLVETAKKYNIPVVLHVQDIYPESISEKIPFFGGIVQMLFLSTDKMIQSSSSKIVTISYKMREYLINSRNLNEEDIEVVRNWQNDEIFIDYQDKEQINDKFVFMYLGSINPTAGVDLVIHSFGKANLPEAKLIIAGGGVDKERCMKIAKESYHNKEIEFIDVVGEDVPRVQAKADVLMLPLKKGIAKTALPSKLVAYMFSAKPIIASIDQNSEPADMIRDNGCGIVIEPENEKKLIMSMQNIFHEKVERLNEMGQNSLSYAENHLSKKHNLSKILTIIKEQKRELKNA